MFLSQFFKFVSSVILCAEIQVLPQHVAILEGTEGMMIRQWYV